MADLLDLSARLIAGEALDWHPFAPPGGLQEVADGVAFVPSFANVTAVRTQAGLVLFDTGSTMRSEDVHDQLRTWSDERVDTVVFTHGHVDHVFGVPRYEADNEAAGAEPLRVVAHEALASRFDRYRLTAGYNGAINARQFSAAAFEWPTDYRYPDEVYRDRQDLEVGGERVELHHAKGETDDATWSWWPHRKVLSTGDLVIWVSPNCGNPQKVQRYPAEWAVALREMAALGAELLVPGHGLPIAGAGAIATVLGEAAELLESLVSQTLEAMNAGLPLDEVIASVVVPSHLLERPYLKPVYDEPEFVVRNLWRLYGGWWDGDPAALKPARTADLAAELAALAGGAGALADRATALAAEGDDRSLRLAGHLAELAARAAPDDEGVAAARSGVFAARAKAESSTMSKGVFRQAAAQAPGRSNPFT